MVTPSSIPYFDGLKIGWLIHIGHKSYRTPKNLEIQSAYCKTEEKSISSPTGNGNDGYMSLISDSHLRYFKYI